MKRKLTLLSLAMVLTVAASAQGYFSFYQLRDLVPQTQSLQPAFIPKNTLTFSLPGSNVGLALEADFQLQDLLSKPDNSIDFVVDFDVLLDATKATNMVNLDVTSHLMHIGYKTKKGAFSLFANARANVDLMYGRDLMEFLANGNGGRVGETIDFSDTRIMANVFHEIGLGYSRQFLGDRLIVGGRIKQITGIYHASLADGASGTITTDANDFSWTIGVQNGTANTAGLDFFFNEGDYPDGAQQDYITSNDNSSFAFDIGAKFKVFDWLHVEAAVNDIGTIEWKEQARNYNTEDREVTFSGVQLRGIENSGDVFRDSVESRFSSNETQRAFETTLPTRTYLSASAFLGPRNRFTVMAFNRSVFGESNFSYAGAYNHSVKYFTFGLVGSVRGNDSEFNLGANIASDIGPVQLYLAMDNALVLNRPERYSKLDFRFGLNLMFGYKRWKEKSEVVDLDEL